MIRNSPLKRKTSMSSHKAALKSGEKKLRTRKCGVKGCDNRFVPRSMMHKACGPDCAEVIARMDREKAERKELKVRKESAKTRLDYLHEAQTAFNAFIRARDADKPCICCGKPLKGHNSLTGHNVDAGHYRSVGSAPHLRFDERNCHAQLVQCNRYGAGRAVDYRIGLIKRIGLEAVEALEADQSVKKWSIDELKAIKATYRAKLKELKETQC